MKFKNERELSYALSIAHIENLYCSTMKHILEIILAFLTGLYCCHCAGAVALLGKNTTVVEPRSGILARGGKERKGRNSLQTVFFFLVFRDFREEPAG